MTKHTAGPWQVSGGRRSQLELGPTCQLHFVGPDNDGVCAVFYDTRTGKGFSDARLISAAPDLLDALKHVIESSEWSCMERETQDFVFAAIAKATGV